jgi:hypothetical protein
MGVLIFSTHLSERFLIMRRTERDINKNVYWTSCRSIGYSFQILMKLEFSVQISEKYSDINLMKLRRVGAEFHAQGQKHMTKLIFAFRNFVNAPDKYCDEY